MIDFKDVSFSYEGSKEGKLKGINFSIKQGECILLTGRSGCGKTTITRLINGLIPEFFPGKLSGEISLKGEKLLEEPMYRIAGKVGSVFQNPKTQFFNTDTDGEIAFGMENNGVEQTQMRERINQTAQELGIKELLGRSIFSLSGGEKQKIAFASVYAMNPEVYLLDEPSSNLDEGAIENLRTHIELLKQQGKTIIIAEHRLSYLIELADRIFYLDRGELKQTYTRKEFLQLSETERKQLGLRSCENQKDGVVLQKKPVNQATASLKFQDVSIGYGKKKILDGINFDASAGEILAVTGQNGVGKSTFSRTLCGLLKPLSGKIIWNNTTTNEKARLALSYLVMQDVNYQLFADSVKHECSFGIKNPDYELVETTLRDLNLMPYLNQHPNTLSGGQKQRVAVAVSMICKKEILIFDEPTSGLDYGSMQAVARLMKNLAHMGKIIFVVTHDREFIAEACTRVLQLEAK